MATLALTILSSRPTKAGKYPIYIRISVKNDKEYIKLNYQLDDSSQWYNGKVVARNDSSMMNKRLAYELSKYKERFENVENGDCYPAKQLKVILTQVDKIVVDVRTFNDFMRQRINEKREENKASHAKMLEDTLKVFEAAEGMVPMIAMNHIVIEHFDRWMKIHGRTDGGRQMRLSQVKARVNEAIKLGLIKTDKHPFVYTKIPTPEIRILDISVESIRKIIQSDVSKSKQMTLAKDMFLLSFYLGGMNYADIINADFSSDEVSYVRLKSADHKTKNRVITLTIRSETRKIIDKYIGEKGRLEFDYKYSVGNFQRYINKCLKLLASTLGIKEGLTFYSARKTFAQFAAEIGIPYPIIEYCLGHSIKTGITINCYVRVKQQQADAAIQRVAEYVAHKLMFMELAYLDPLGILGGLK